MSLRRTMAMSLGNMLPLDSVQSTPMVAYALRRLKISYTGALIKVINSAQNVTGDVQYNSNNEIGLNSNVTIVTSTNPSFTVGQNYSLSTFAGGNTVSVIAWYDQGPQQRHLVVNTTPPLLLDNTGAFKLVDGKPCVYNPSGSTSQLFCWGTGAFYFNSPTGQITFAKHTSTTKNITANGIGLWGAGNLRDSPGCTSYGGDYMFSVAVKDGVTGLPSSHIGITNRYFKNIGAGCIAVSSVQRGLALGNSDLYPSTAGRLTTITDKYIYPTSGGQSQFTLHVNGNLDGFFNYPYATTASYYFPKPTLNDTLSSPPTISNSSYFFMFPNDSGLDVSFQELIIFDGQNNFSERSAIETNMGKYFTIPIG